MTTDAAAAPAAPAATTAPAAPPAGAPAAPAPPAVPAAPVALGDAPAAPALPAAIGEPAAAPAAPAAPQSIAYEPTGNVGLDVALGFFGKAGLAPESAEMKAAVNGDFTLLKATLATQAKPGWEQHVALAEKAHADITAADAAKKAADRGRIVAAAGGEENWTKVQAWATANAEPAERDAVNAALGQGGLVAAAMAEWLSNKYAAAAGTVVNPKEAAPGGGAPGAGARQGLSAREYTDAVAKLNIKLRGNLNGSPEYAALQQQRAIGRKAGR